MNKLNQRLQKLTLNLTIALFVLTALNYALKSCRVQQKRAELSEAAAIAEKEGIIPEKAFAYRDGKDYQNPEVIKPYATALDQLKQKCQESRMEVAGMVSAIVKHEKSEGFQTTHLDALESFLHMVESGFDRHPAKCLQVYSHAVQKEKR